MPTPDELTGRLTALHEAYVDKVNRLIAEDREDLIQDLVDGYADEALALLAPAVPPA
jgi:hypothetical protein